MRKLKFLTMIGAIIFVLSTAGVGYAFSVDLTVPNESVPTMTYATVTGTVDGTDDSLFHFRVDLAPGLSSALNGNGVHFGMDEFFFNTDLTLTSGMFKNWDPEIWNIAFDKNADGFGNFDIKLADPTRNIRETHLYFDIDYISTVTELNFLLLSDDPAGNGNGHFAAHIAGFGYNGIGSTFVRDGQTPVPEPSTVLLLGAGLAGLGFYNRKRFRK